MSSDQDLRNILGLDGRSGILWLALLESTLVLLMLRNFDATDHYLPAIAGYLLVAVSAVIIVVAPTDPLAPRYTWLIVVIGPLATYLTNLRLIGTPGRHTLWVSLAYEMVLGLVAVRGRMLPAFAGVLGVGLTVLLGSSDQLDAASVVSSFASMILVAALAIFAATMRPTLRSLHALRTEALRTAAAEATIAAAARERDRQMAQLEAVARPMLERIASGIRLDTDERETCRLLEAELRDGLRAPLLASGPVVGAARAARRRGVEVTLLDDGGFAGVSASVRDAVLATVAAELACVDTGAVTVRVLPARRAMLATVVVAEHSACRRIEIDHAGTVGEPATHVWTERSGPGDTATRLSRL